MKKPKSLLAATLLLCTILPRVTQLRADDVNDRRIVPGDIVMVEVSGEKDLSHKLRVQPSGTVNYPLLGHLRVADKTPADVAALVAQKLNADYLVDAKVEVTIKEHRPAQIPRHRIPPVPEKVVPSDMWRCKMG